MRLGLQLGRRYALRTEYVCAHFKSSKDTYESRRQPNHSRDISGCKPERRGHSTVALPVI